MSCTCQTNPNANSIIITCLVLRLHITSLICMSQHSLILSLYFLLHLCLFTSSCSLKPQCQPSLVFHSLASFSWVFSLFLRLSPYIPCFSVLHFHCTAFLACLHSSFTPLPCILVLHLTVDHNINNYTVLHVWHTFISFIFSYLCLAFLSCTSQIS